MKTIGKRVLSFLCAVCVLLSGNGDLLALALSYGVETEETEEAYLLSASEENEYQITAQYGADSGIPEDAELVVAEIKEGDEGYEDYVARGAKELGQAPETLQFARVFDITLKNPVTGEESQPDGNVKLSVELPDGNLGEYENVDVVHIPDGDDEAPEVMDSAVNGEAVEFETGGFSVYVIVGADDVFRRTYEFFIRQGDDWASYMFTSDSGEVTSKQIVRDGETPVVPQPTADSEENPFAGWYERTNTGNEEPVLADSPYDFNKPVTENEVVELYAQFKGYLYAVFHDRSWAISRLPTRAAP